MRYFFNTTSVAACGLVTSLMTVFLVVFVERLTGFDIFTFSIWLIVPVEAIATGMAAASGYYFGSLYFHTRPNALLLFQMVIVAGATQLLIYYVQYATFVLDDGRRVSDFMPFARYLDITLTSAHYRVGRGARDVGEIGEFGYWLAAIQFVGFLIGGLGVFGILLSHPICEQCKKFFRVLANTDKLFISGNDLAQYHDSLFQLPVDSQQFAEMASAHHSAPATKGAWKLNMKLYGCPECKAQAIWNEVSILNGNNWKKIEKLSSKVAIPAGVSLAGVFKAKR
jgi:hypothetical protein